MTQLESPSASKINIKVTHKLQESKSFVVKTCLKSYFLKENRYLGLRANCNSEDYTYVDNCIQCLTSYT